VDRTRNGPPTARTVEPARHECMNTREVYDILLLWLAVASGLSLHAVVVRQHEWRQLTFLVFSICVASENSAEKDSS
jgi:hypothetical protein